MDRCSAVVAVVATTDRVVAVVALEAIHKDPYFHIKILLFGHTRLQREKNHVHINVTLGGALTIIVFWSIPDLDGHHLLHRIIPLLTLTERPRWWQCAWRACFPALNPRELVVAWIDLRGVVSAVRARKRIERRL